MDRVPVKPGIFRWARERAGLTPEDLEGRFKKAREWESGEIQPTLRQLEEFARVVHLPIGCMFLSKPLEEPVPIPDFRRLDGETSGRPSPNLLETIYKCQERQSWYRDFVQDEGEPELCFVGSANLDTPHALIADRMRETIGFDLDARQQCSTIGESIRLLVQRAEDIGILVMISGVVGNNNHRRLNPEEFRGFALADAHAPLIFINGADRKAAQIFTLAYELAHIWLGQSALSDLEPDRGRNLRPEEVWCNAVAAEFLVPLSALQPILQMEEVLSNALFRLTHQFKVSNFVILRRLLDVQWLSRERFDEAWEQESNRLRALIRAESGGGGNFYRRILARVSRRFAHDLLVSTIEGKTQYTDAFHMLGISKTQTFDSLAHEVGVSK